MKSLLSFTALLLLSYVLGAAYRVTGLRDVLVAEPFAAVETNVIRRMSAIAGLGQAESQRLLTRHPRFFVDRFYRLVDNDNSLTIRSQHIRLSGAILTSVADFAVITIFFSLFFAFAALTVPTRLNFSVANALLAVGWIFWAFVLPPRSKRHLELSNGQLDFVAQHYSLEVRNAAMDALQQLPDEAQQGSG